MSITQTVNRMVLLAFHLLFLRRSHCVYGLWFRKHGWLTLFRRRLWGGGFANLKLLLAPSFSPQKWHTYDCKVRHFWLLNGLFVLLYVFRCGRIANPTASKTFNSLNSLSYKKPPEWKIVILNENVTLWVKYLIYNGLWWVTNFFVSSLSSLLISMLFKPLRVDEQSE